MSFEIDLETFRDLEVFTQGEGSRSIFSIFNRTRTEGGSRVLAGIMQNPSSDPLQLINRRDSIRYFHTEKPELDFSYNQLDMIEHYLSFNKRFLRNNFLDAAWDHWYNKINTTNDYYIIKTGISELIKLLKSVSALSEKFSTKPVPDYLSSIHEPVQEFLKTKIIKEVLDSNKKKTSCFQLNRLDRFFRKQEINSIKQLLRFVYEADVFESAAEVLDQSRWSLPEYILDNSEEIRFSGLAHPAIKNPVRNDFYLNKNQSVIFLTGPNMAGKSSFLKAAGLAVYLAHIGFPVPAKNMKTPVYKGLMTTINLPDNIYQGLSHYYSEVKRVKKTALKLLEHGSMFVIFDELFRGTNAKDAYDASLLVISDLAKIKRCKFLISTHIVELADELKKIPNISFKLIESRFQNEKPVFTYKIKEGVSEERMGTFIINNEGIFAVLKEIIKRQELLDL